MQFTNPINNRLTTLVFPGLYTKKPLIGLNKWVAALRSGEYDQCSGDLATELNPTNSMAYCCLGVLSKLQGRLAQDKHNFFDGAHSDASYLSQENPAVSDDFSIQGHLPSGIRIEYTTDYGSPISAVPPSLSSLNDSGLSFDKIADILEEAYYDPETKPTDNGASCAEASGVSAL